jgi:hypothetical protein
LIAGMPAQNPCVLIATPTRGSPKMQYMQSVIWTFGDLAKRNIRSDFLSSTGANIVFQRCLLVSRFLERREFTHVFLCDDDMVFPPDLCARMVAADKPIVGTVATTREIDLRRVEKAVSDGVPFRQALLMGHTWIVGHDANSDRAVDGSPALRKVASLGGAVVLIRRDALELMIEKNVVTKFGQFGQKFYGFFTMRKQDAELEMVPEDHSFYRRWRIDCQQELWALTDAPILHIGDFPYGGCYGDLPQSLQWRPLVEVLTPDATS